MQCVFRSVGLIERYECDGIKYTGRGRMPVCPDDGRGEQVCRKQLTMLLSSSLYCGNMHRHGHRATLALRYSISTCKCQRNLTITTTTTEGNLILLHSFTIYHSFIHFNLCLLLLRQDLLCKCKCKL